MTITASRPAPVTVPAFSTPGRCTLCCGSHIRCVLDLGEQPLANGLLSSAAEVAPRFPLRLGYCEGCGHVELMDRVPPEAMFGTYVYRTGASAPMVAHFTELAAQVSHRLSVVDPGWVCEIGSNDGTFLRALRGQGFAEEEVIGVDPCSVARGEQFTVHRYFGTLVAEQLRDSYGPAACVVACNVLAHCPQPTALLKAAHGLLARNGLLVLEVPYLRDMVDSLTWDQVYHEHHSVFSAQILARLLTVTGFVAEQVERLSVHGGSLRVWARAVSNIQQHSPCPEWHALQEQEWRSPVDWERFGADVERHATRLRELCGGAERLIGYGAPAKATVLLNYAGIKPTALFDTTPEKAGRYVPGVNAPILPMDEIRDHRPDRALLLAWNYQDAILARETWLHGKWVIPFPVPRTA